MKLIKLEKIFQPPLKQYHVIDTKNEKMFLDDKYKNSILQIMIIIDVKMVA